jgi:transcriptional regulator with XRE-family HTH domain
MSIGHFHWLTPMPNSPPSKTLQQTIKELRAHLGLTQQNLAVMLKKALTTVARWETSRPPKGAILFELQGLALDNGLPELASVFEEAIVTDALVGSRALTVPVTDDEKHLVGALLLLLRLDISVWRENRVKNPILAITKAIREGVDIVRTLTASHQLTQEQLDKAARIEDKALNNLERVVGQRLTRAETEKRTRKRSA